MIESWHSTVEFKLRRVEHFTTRARARARARVAAWIEEYNNGRPGSSVLGPIALCRPGCGKYVRVDLWGLVGTMRHW